MAGMVALKERCCCLSRIKVVRGVVFWMKRDRSMFDRKKYLEPVNESC